MIVKGSLLKSKANLEEFELLVQLVWFYMEIKRMISRFAMNANRQFTCGCFFNFTKFLGDRLRG